MTYHWIDVHVTWGRFEALQAGLGRGRVQQAYFSVESSSSVVISLLVPDAFADYECLTRVISELRPSGKDWLEFMIECLLHRQEELIGACALLSLQ